MTIWIDSLYQINQDTVFVLNRVSSVCDKCEKMNSSYAVYLKNQPTFLQSRIVKKENGDYNLRDTANYLIKSTIESDSIWLFDSLNLRYAIFQEKRFVPVFNNTIDSVKIFTVGNEDTIIISKNFGIIKFPDFKGNHYNLIGIEGNSIYGNRNLYFEDFINPDVGDIFQYSISVGGRFPSFEEIQKHTVQSIQKYEDSIIINTAMLSKIIKYDYYSPYETLYKSSEGKLSYYKSDLKFLDNYNFQDISNTNPVKVTYDTTFKCLSKSFSTNATVLMGDTVYSTYNPYYKDNIKQYRYGSGIGLIYFSNTFNHNGPYANYNYKNLQGYSHHGIIHGNIYSDSHFQFSENPDTNQNLVISIYPTAFNDFITIQFERKINQASISIIDMTGRIRYSADVFNLDNTMINPTGLEKGIYILKIDGPDLDQFKRKIIKI